MNHRRIFLFIFLNLRIHDKTAEYDALPPSTPFHRLSTLNAHPPVTPDTQIKRNYNKWKTRPILPLQTNRKRGEETDGAVRLGDRATSTETNKKYWSLEAILQLNEAILFLNLKEKPTNKWETVK